MSDAELRQLAEQAAMDPDPLTRALAASVLLALIRRQRRQAPDARPVSDSPGTLRLLTTHEDE